MYETEVDGKKPKLIIQYGVMFLFAHLAEMRLFYGTKLLI